MKENLREWKVYSAGAHIDTVFYEIGWSKFKIEDDLNSSGAYDCPVTVKFVMRL